jgi:hypothetical protein
MPRSSTIALLKGALPMKTLPLFAFFFMASFASAAQPTLVCGKVETIRASIDDDVGAIQTIRLQGSTTEYVVVPGLIPAVTPLALASKQTGKEICFEGVIPPSRVGILRFYVESATYH